MKKLIIIGIFLLLFNHEYEIKQKKHKVYISNVELIDEYISKYSKIYRIDKKQVYAQIDLESEFNPRLKNTKSSAYGLPQFLRGTGEWMYSKTYPGRKYNHYNTTIEEQIHMICYYLDYLNRKYDNNRRLVLIEYSGGTKGYIKAYQKRYKKYEKLM